MLFFKKLSTMLLVFMCSLSLIGCATTTYDRGEGVVLAAKKMKEHDLRPREGTKTGATVGGVTGAVGGAAAGGFLGLALCSFSTAGAPVIVAATLGGAAIGAVIVGSVGAAAGAGVGYVVDVNNRNAALYQFTVKPDNSEKTITITQYSSVIPVNARVRILEKDNNVFIKSR